MWIWFLSSLLFDVNHHHHTKPQKDIFVIRKEKTRKRACIGSTFYTAKNWDSNRFDNQISWQQLWNKVKILSSESCLKADDQLICYLYQNFISALGLAHWCCWFHCSYFFRSVFIFVLKSEACVHFTSERNHRNYRLKTENNNTEVLKPRRARGL